MRPKTILSRSKSGRLNTVVGTRLCLLLVVFILALTSSGFAQQSSKTDRPAAPEVLESYEGGAGLYQTLIESFDQALEMEKKDLERVSDVLESLQSEADQVDQRFNQIQLMISTYSNLLLLPSVDVQALEQARTRQNVAAGYVEEQIAQIKAAIEKWEKALQEAREQAVFYENQRAEIKAQPAHVPINKELVARLNAGMDLLETKRERIDQILETYRNRLERFNSLLANLQPVTDKIREQIEARKKSRILEHESSPVLRLFQGELRRNMAEIVEKIQKLVTHAAWQKPGMVKWEEYGAFLAVFLFLLAVFQAVLYGCGRYCGAMMQHSLADDRFWHYIFIKLVKKSLPWAGAMVFLYFYPIRPVYRLTPVFALLPLIIRILALIMAVRWGKIFLRALGGHIEEGLFHRIYSPLTRLLSGILVYGTGYLLVSRIICSNCISLTVWRLVFEFLLVAWCIYFFHVFQREAPDSSLAAHPRYSVLKPVLTAVGYGLVLPGLAAELLGYGGLASYWYAGLSKTVLLAFWAFVLYQVLREADVAAHIERSDEIDEDELGPRPYPVRWLLVRMLRIGLVGGSLFMLFLGWGAPKTFLADILHAINYEVSFGDFRLSVMGFVYALIVLLFVHTFTVISKEFLRSRVLREAEMETGLKDSILRITGYVLWAMGILIALRTVGISATALTVVFGALGIGLGFGLQNIFNNFLSGIILLFERPIQVGDVIEIGGIWGTVREINVRSTQVRSFDNAELIIPNSDFISQLVTNWSFRDARVRRTVEVRVAYGSDIELVRQVLMDVVYQHPRILRRPHPEVLFSDFGESALIFKLRFWVHIDWFLIVETDVRFDIDKQFRKNGITIPFPQRDVYVKTGKLEPAAVPGEQEQEQEES